MKIDNRIRVTKKIIKDSLTKLLIKDPINSITIKELCYEACVNRSTFYAHFDDIYACLKEIEDDMFDDLKKSLNLEKSFYTSDLKDWINSLESVYYSIFLFFQSHADMCKVILSNNSLSSISNNSGTDFISRALKLGKKVVSEIYKGIDDVKLSFLYDYVSNGIIGLLKTWLNNGQKESITEMSIIVKRLVEEGIGFLK